MNGLIKYGILLGFYGIVTLLFFRNKYDIERKKYNLWMIPLMVLIVLFFDELSFTPERVFLMIIALLITALTVLLLITISGYTVRIKADKEAIISIIKSIDGYKENEALGAYNKTVFVRGKEKIRIYDSVGTGHTISMDFRLKSRGNNINEVIEKMIVIDPRKTAKKEGLIFTIVGIACLGLGLFFQFG